LIQFFNQLQIMKPFVKVFINESFQSLLIFPVVRARKEFREHGTWIVEVAILQELYFYNYFPCNFKILITTIIPQAAPIEYKSEVTAREQTMPAASNTLTIF
jgi:hypothetical protein